MTSTESDVSWIRQELDFGPSDESPGDETAVKGVARDLLGALKRQQLVLDWRKRQQARAQVRVTIEELLDRGLPPAYDADLYQRKCDAVYRHVFDTDAGTGRSIDAAAS